jgi:hypothetical protein
MNTKHSPHYLNEIGSRWDNRIPKDKVTKNVEHKTVLVLLPVMDMLRSLFVNAIGRQLSWTENGGISKLRLSAVQY